MAGVKYAAFRKDTGWTGWAADGTATTEGVEIYALKAQLTDAPVGLSIMYKVRQKDLGWSGWYKDGAVAGSTTNKKRIESIKICLVNNPNGKFSAGYRVKLEVVGWLGWAYNGAECGSSSAQPKSVKSFLVKISS